MRVPARESLAEGMFFAGSRGVACFPRPFARASPHAGRHGGRPPGTHPAKARTPRRRDTVVTPVWAMVLVSMSPAPGPPGSGGVVGRLEIYPPHASKAKAYAIAP
jgi:hypothetical protein